MLPFRIVRVDEIGGTMNYPATMLAGGNAKHTSDAIEKIVQKPAASARGSRKVVRMR